MKQRLRRDAAAIQADAARVLLHVHEGYLHPEVRGIEGRGVAARPGTEDRQLCGFARHVSREAREGTAARSPEPPTSETASRRHRRSRDGRRTATAEGVGVVRICRLSMLA